MDTTLPTTTDVPSLDLEQALQTYPGWTIDSPTPPTLIQKLDSGLTNDCYLVQIGAERCVLRINAKNSRIMGLDRVNEGVVLEHAALAGIGPEIIYCAPKQGLLVTRYVAGGHWSLEEAQTQRNIERLSQTLKQLHRLPAVEKKLIPEVVCERYWDAVKAQFVIIPQRFMSLRQTMDQLMHRALSDYPEKVLCHNDLLLGNIIDNGEHLVLLDWEYAAMGDPFFDLAVIVHNQQFDERQLQQLLECYVGYVDKSVTTHFLYSYAIYIYIDMLWYWFQSASHPGKGFASTAESKLDTLVAVLHELGL